MLLSASAITVAGLIVLLAVLSPGHDDDPSPSSFSNGSRGAKAAYLLLGSLGYHTERWTAPIRELSRAKADAHTTLVINDGKWDGDTEQAVQELLARGGRVLAIGMAGGLSLPHSAVATETRGPAHGCVAQPEGLSPLAATGDPVEMTTGAYWSGGEPRFETAYACEGRPVVVTYSVGPGTVVWWASGLPIENRSIRDGGNAGLLLRSLGPPGTTRVVWDEADAVEPPGLWSYASGPALRLLWAQLALLALLFLFSFARRNGPLRPDPVVLRSSPLEFVTAMGTLYQRNGATAAVVELAYRRFLARLEPLLGPSTHRTHGGAELAARVSDPALAASLAADLEACEAVRLGSPPTPARALRLVQALHDHAAKILTRRTEHP